MAKNNKNRKQNNNDAEFAQEVAVNAKQQQAAQNNASQNANQFENENQNV
ncbi:hypothetical protein ACFQI7_18045 [Paenibacillus allorhizosphaerae]|nr:hypothetical protein [Paenibacillus allorhizosphaerae]